MAENIRPSQISLKRLALALIHKGTKNSRFVHDDEWTYDGRTYSYKNEIYPWARYEFDDLYPQSIPDEEFTQSFIQNIYRDPLRARVAGNQPEQPIIAKLPETLPTTTQPAPASNIPPPPIITKPEKPPPPPLQAKETEEEKLAAEQEAKEGQTIPQKEQVIQPIRRSFQLPKMPTGLRSAALTAGSNLGIVFREYVGQHATFGRAVAIAGGLAAGVATGGNPLAIAAGAGAGLLGSSYLSSPEGKAFMQNLGRGNVNSQRNSLPRRSKKSNFKFLKLLLVGGVLSFMLLAVVGGFLAPFGGPITPTTEAPGIPTVSSSNLFISLNGPGGCIDNCKADNNQEITFEASLTYNGIGTANVEVSGKLPDGVDLSRATLEKWSLSGRSFSQIIPNLTSKTINKLPLTFKPDNSTVDFWISHSISGRIVKLELPSDITSGVITTPPNSDDCAGKYTSQFKSNPNSNNKNFGDPTCTYSDDDLYAYLTILDPDQAPFWWLLVDCESTYRPNIVNISAEDKAGAWGLFQMGRGKNGLLDHGDVLWIKQISNAIDYKNSLENGPAKYRFRGEESYWHCARPGGLSISANKPKPVR